MKTMKKLLALVLALALVVTAFAACSGGTTTESKSETSKTEESKTEESKTEESSEPEDDGTIHPMRIVQPGTLCADFDTGMAAVNEKLKADGVNIEVSVTRIPWALMLRS